MRIKGVLDISGTHDFEYIPSQDLWFPKEKHLNCQGKNDDDIKILGGTVQFDGIWIKIFRQGKDNLLILFNFLKPITLLYPTTKLLLDNKFIAVELQKKQSISQSFWETLEKDSLDSRNNSTYIALDSIEDKNVLLTAYV
jgi:hypothetical protein